MTAVDTVIHKLARDGYANRFRPDDGGMRCLDDDWLYRPDDLRIEHIVQVENGCDPDDGGVVLALRSCLHGTAGVCVVPLDQPLPRLRDGRRPLEQQ